jgi:peptidoglycan/xylan/chitin deacetylase (PgdA/CDA1 family)
MLNQSEDERLSAMRELSEAHGISGRAIVDDLCMTWEEIARLASHPLAAIGCHTATHANLALLDDDGLRRELYVSRKAIEARVNRPVRHLAYPYGQSGTAGAREFGVASALGFASAVTTRPGVLFRDHAKHPTALPRVSINGLWQDPRIVDILLSGAAFALWNRGRRVNVG